MKKLLSIRHSLLPIWQKDMDFLQQGMAESFASFLKSFGFGRERYIISGCNITDDGRRISMLPGWAFWSGEILPVRSLPVTDHDSGSVKIKLTRQTAYNPEGVKTVTAGNITSNVNTYQDDYLNPEIIEESITTQSYDLAIEEGFWDVATRIKHHAQSLDTGIRPLSSQYGDVSYRRIGGVVQVFGSLFADASGGFGAEIVSGLPRPSTELKFPCVSSIGGLPADGYMLLTPAGKLYALTKAARISISHILYLTSPAWGSNAGDGHFSTIMNSNP